MPEGETMELISWLEDRAANCRRIAATKYGADRSGWLEDEVYFRAAVAAINQSRRVLEVLGAINGALNMGTQAAEVLDENSPIRDAMRDVLTPNA